MYPYETICFNIRIIQNKNEDGQTPQEIGVDATGEESKPADWDTLGAFSETGSITPEDLIRMIPIYENTAFGTAPSETSKPKKLWL